MTMRVELGWKPGLSLLDEFQPLQLRLNTASEVGRLCTKRNILKRSIGKAASAGKRFPSYDTNSGFRATDDNKRPDTVLIDAKGFNS